MAHAPQSWPTNSSLLQPLLGRVTELKMLDGSGEEPQDKGSGVVGGGP